jgi:NAD(P)-dependent dehydrogenase (short-subunit alcohol dehydrogenase family)
MNDVSLHGKIAVITGAGRGLGRAYALAFAERGARLVVNDRGTEMDGSGASAQVAQEVVDLIRSNGGHAVANGDDVGSADGGRAIIRQALETYGRLDIVVNNAGICRDRPFAQTPLAEFELNWRIHVGGHVNVIGAAWPFMVEQKYGRIIATGSGAGLFGLRNEAAYAAAKGGIHGLMRTLAIEGRDHGILVNSICPGGFSRMHEEAFPDPAVRQMMRDVMPVELVAPAVVWLASDACHVSGQQLSVWGGRIVRVVVGTGRGLVDRRLTAEKIADHWDRISSIDELYEPVDGIDDVVHWRESLTQSPG